MKTVTKVIITLLVLAILAGAGVYVWRYISEKKAENEDVEYVYVESVDMLTGGAASFDNRYMGTVEAQATQSVKKNSDLKVKEVFVTVEQEVKEGDKLFEYDMDEMDLKLKQLELELTSTNNSIQICNQQISQLVKERDEAPADSKLGYTAQIQSLQAQLNQLNYDVQAKQLDIDRQRAAMEENVVVSPMDGIIKEIKNEENDNDNSSNYNDNSSDDPDAFIKIMAKGQYRVKATGDETNIRTMSVGDRVVIRPRIGDDMVWTGTISEIDLEHPDNGSNNDMYYYGGGGETTTKYPFYIDIDSIDGLLLGQHVYVEPDEGQGEVKSGLWLDDMYILSDEAGGSYVWAENAEGKIEKRVVSLGEFDDENMKYEILSGLTAKDYIAFPENRIKEGMTATKNYEDVLQYETYDPFEGGGSDEDDMGEEYDEMYEDEMYDDEFYEDDMVDDAENGDEDGLNGDMTIEENLPDESEGGEDGVGKEDTEELSGESLDM
ncbi:MAG: efflux RND transporter periplasmic adaptor subunit [Lachnospiraceae bacterium]|nr:efflux RND transporter periplasmic adaptor subunit [Lachnospiraceae bacterium]